MKKLIAINDNSEIKEDCIVKFHSEFHKKEMIGIIIDHFKDGYNIEISKNEAIVFHTIENKNIQKVQLHVIDTECQIKTKDIVYDRTESCKPHIFCNDDGSCHYIGTFAKVIASTDKSLNLPSISNIEKCLELVGEEVEFKLKPCASCDLLINDRCVYEYKCPVTIIKPITKCNNSNKVLSGENADWSIQNLFKVLPEIYKAGYTQAECNLPSYDDVSHAIGYTISQSKQGLSHHQILKEYNKVHRKPYIPNNNKVYTEEEVIELLKNCSYQVLSINHCNQAIERWFEKTKK